MNKARTAAYVLGPLKVDPSIWADSAYPSRPPERTPPEASRCWRRTSLQASALRSTSTATPPKPSTFWKANTPSSSTAVTFRAPPVLSSSSPPGSRTASGIGAVKSRKLNLYAPAAMVGYFDELAEATKRDVDPTALSEIASRYSMEVVAPVPEGYV